MPIPSTKTALLRWSQEFNLRQKIFLGAGLLILVWNLVSTAIKFSNNEQQREKTPYIFLGYKFLGLNQILASHPRIGYLTDKDMDDRVNAMEFAQAEYILVPITLDLNNPKHEYLLLNFSTPAAAFSKIKELGLTVWKQNQFGIILAKNPLEQGR